MRIGIHTVINAERKRKQTFSFSFFIELQNFFELFEIRAHISEV